MLQRIGLFVITNIAVIVLLNIVFLVLEQVFGIRVTGAWYFAVIAGVIWFWGAFISLSMSKWSAKRAYKLSMIDNTNISEQDKKVRLVYDTVTTIAESNNIKTPEIGIYMSQNPNAFATGSSKNNSLVAVSSGLLEAMTDREVEAVVAHEMAHVINGDMVTMTLLQWVINTLIVFAARMIANILSQFVDENMAWIVYFASSILLDILFGLLSTPIVMWFSRHREFKADEWSARYVGKEKMIAALEALQKMQTIWKENAKFATMQISTPKQSGLKALFSSHPALELRIKHLEDFRV